jgi:8-oxo-dGTP diphosphatase
MALSAIINHYDKSYGYEDFAAMARIMPWAVRMDFDGNGCARIERIDLFRLGMDAGDEWWKVGTEYAGTLKSYMFVVIFARYRDKWVYCRARDRGVFETAGGHIEEGETPLEAAKRELYEETGAAEYEIEAAFDYTVRRPRAWSAGQAFFARIGRLGDMPDYEMAEIGLFDSIPDRMRFPEILPALYRRLQMWLNLQSAKDELWDVYDSGRNLKGRTHRRGDPLPAGDYHLVAHVWLRNGRGEFLITRRAPSKGYPGMWECTGGSVVAGDE